MIQWEIQAREILSCNCDAGCPCQFSSLPTRGNCEAVVGLAVDRGRFGEVNLDGTKVAAVLWWPKAIHEGDGKALIVVDESATEDQRQSLITILSGAETEPGATIFNVFASTYAEVFDPIFRAIDMEVDVDGRRGHLKVDGLIDTSAEPLRNPVTGDEHRARIDLPSGFEYRLAEVARGRSRTQAPLALSFRDSHAHFANLHMTQSGVVG